MDTKSIVQVFDNPEFGSIRAMRGEDGEPWFVAKDVCGVLGYTNPSKAIADHVDAEDKLNNETLSSLGQRGGWLVNESGLYSLILTSKLPGAKCFKRWVTHEVLPAIRRNGAYATPQTIEGIIADPRNGIKLLEALVAEQDKNKALEAENATMRQKALFADAVAASDGTCLVGELAKMLRQNGVEVGQNRLFAILREDGYLGKSGSNRNVPTQRAMEQGLFRIKETSIVHTDGHVTISRTPKVTGKGQRVFFERYLGASEIVSA